jgi:hypothetical protein
MAEVVLDVDDAAFVGSSSSGIVFFIRDTSAAAGNIFSPSA